MTGKGISTVKVEFFLSFDPENFYKPSKADMNRSHFVLFKENELLFMSCKVPEFHGYELRGKYIAEVRLCFEFK